MKDLTPRFTVSAIVGLGGVAVSASVSDNVTNIAQANMAVQNAVDNNWGEVGHYSTMATVLYLAGFSPKDAKAIALAAWGPDTDKRNAITVPNFNNGKDTLQPQMADHLLDGEKNPAKVIAVQQKLAMQVGEILRTIKLYENDSTKKEAYLSQASVQKVLHSFGDSFAHVQADGTHYDPKFGHAVDSKTGNDPDTPSANASAYKNYVNTLFKVASQVSVIPRVPSSTVENLADKVTKTEYGRVYLYDAIGSLTKAEATSLVRSPVKECGLSDNCQKLGVSSQITPAIHQVYETSTPVKKK